MIPNVKIMRVNRDRREKGRIVDNHSHNYYEFVYYLNAQGQLTLDGEQIRIKNGRFTVITPGTLHSEYHTQDGKVFFFVFECDFPLENKVYDDDDYETVKSICESLAEEFFSPGQYSAELLELKARELVLRILRRDPAGEDNHRDISYAAGYIERGFRENIDLRALAADIGYGYDYFHHSFKKKYGLSPKQYQQSCRISCAKQLLVTGKYTCTEVAYLSGFSDSAQFSLIFKRECGTTPREFAKSAVVNEKL